MDNRALSLAKKILNPEPKDRLTVDKVIHQPWMQTVFADEGDRFVTFVLFAGKFGLLLVLWQFSDVIVFDIHKARLPKH